MGEPEETTLFLCKLRSKMIRLAIVVVAIFATAIGKPQVGLLNPWFPTSRIVTSYNYQRPLPSWNDTSKLLPGQLFLSPIYIPSQHRFFKCNAVPKRSTVFFPISLCQAAGKGRRNVQFG